MLLLDMRSEADWGCATADFDPENEVPDENENSDSEESADENAGTEHYLAVGYATLIPWPPKQCMY